MTYTPHIERLPADYWTDRAGQPIVAIVAHGTGGTDSRVTLQHGDGRKVSIHVLIAKNGTIYRMVPDEKGANHAGADTSSFTLHGITYAAGQVNRATLGFELENLQDGRDPYTDAQLLAMGWQIAQWRAQWGNLPILRHADLDPSRRRDPYQLSVNDMEQWVIKALPPVSPPGLPRLMHVRGVPIYQAQSRTGAKAGYLTSAETVTIDAVYPDGGCHLADGRGFVDLAALEPV